MTAFWKKNKKDKLADIPKKKAVKVSDMPTAVAEIKDKTGKASHILVSPILTEKASTGEAHSHYSFQVARNTTKPEVRKAIKQLYGILPIKVNMVNVKGKKVRFGRFDGVQKDWKKAVVTLKKGDKIDLYK